MSINEMNMPVVDNMNVTPSDPIDTRSTYEEPTTAPVEVPEEAPVEETPEAPIEEPTTPAEAPVAEETPAEPEAPTVPSGQKLMEMMAKQNYQPEETELDVLDEFGNLDPTKFQSFMEKNNANIFEKATEAALAKIEVRDMEADTWGKINTDFPEIEKSDALNKALRGARIQDLSAGGDGDLSRLAKDLIAPIRDAQIKAVEDANKTIKAAEVIEVTTPKNATSTPQAQPSLMTQLSHAIASGDQQRQTEIRHAIRKERIFGKDNSGTN